MIPNYHFFSEIARHETDDVRKKKNYAGWDSSGLAYLTMLHKDIFNIQAGPKVDIVNVYQHTSSHPQRQRRSYAALTRALNMITDPCMLFGDFNASIQGGRLNYAPAHAKNRS